MISSEGVQCEKRRPKKESWRKLTFKEWVEGKGMILGHSREARKELGEGGAGERESEKEKMNKAHCHKRKDRIRKHLLELATRSPVVA